MYFKGSQKKIFCSPWLVSQRAPICRKNLTNLSLTAYPNGRRIFDRTAETTSVKFPMSSFCYWPVEGILYVPFPLSSWSSSFSFPIYLSHLLQLLSCCLLYKHWAKTVQIHPCLTPRLILNQSVIPQLVRIAASWPLQSSLIRIYILSLYGNPILIKVAQSWECDTQSNAFEWSLKHIHKSLLNSLHFWFIVRNMIPGDWTFSETCLCCTHFFSKFWF